MAEVDVPLSVQEPGSLIDEHEIVRPIRSRDARISRQPINLSSKMKAPINIGPVFTEDDFPPFCSSGSMVPTKPSNAWVEGPKIVTVLKDAGLNGDKFDTTSKPKTQQKSVVEYIECDECEWVCSDEEEFYILDD